MEEGYEKYICTKCSDTYGEKILEKKEHSYINGICSFCSEYDAEKFLTYELDNVTNTYKIVSAYKGIKKITIPNLYNGIPVSTIGSQLFLGNTMSLK